MRTQSADFSGVWPLPRRKYIILY
uniref:Uncharacterized protein n=1 Tax=Arundo donax TaxID=35708 RepID=A0A0A9H396_ARUDO